MWFKTCPRPSGFHYEKMPRRRFRHADPFEGFFVDVVLFILLVAVIALGISVI